MKINDYIKTGVKLADGWTYHDGDCLHEETEQWFIGCKLPQVQLDALAAQLTRQINTTGLSVMITPTFTTVMYYDHEEEHEISSSHGKDITMNTIVAIVDSKELK